jgi:Na+-transporting NADH:ubiquinone oxidoreductase subunit NqrD
MNSAMDYTTLAVLGTSIICVDGSCPKFVDMMKNYAPSPVSIMIPYAITVLISINQSQLGRSFIQDTPTTKDM